MRIARVLPVPRGSSEEGGETAAEPMLALERDGAVYSVAALERARDTAWSPERFPDAGDFHTRVVALACAGLDELDDALRRGERPSEARLLPGTFLWLPPCAPDRSLLVHVDAAAASALGAPAHRIGNARSLVGHEARVPFPADEASPDFELGIAAVLGEDLERATEAEADAAIVGVAIVNDWVARDAERVLLAAGAPASAARDFATQLGPVLVTRDELGDLGALRTRARIDGEALASAPLGELPCSIATAIAAVSTSIELRAGDVVALGPVRGGSARSHGRSIVYDERVDLAIERLGTLGGAPVRGPARR
jgi:2-keto-4-pentenoate hydratase/2-oxohepta-3-ene-1,7-dioic acid hydratase in catechol pathway